MLEGGLQLATTCRPPPTGPDAATPITGAPGTVTAAVGTTPLEGAEAAPSPAALTARTTKVYRVPLVSPVTVAAETAPVTLSVRTVTPATRTAIWYPVMGEPPGSPGTQLRVADWLPATAVTRLGAAGTPCGTTVFDDALSAPAPKVFTARTWKVYAVPLVRFRTTTLVAVALATVTVLTSVPPVETTTSKPKGAGPPFGVGRVQLTVADASPATAVPMPGAAGVRTVRVWSVNFSASMLRRVSTPSLTLWPTTFAPVWVTVRAPLTTENT